MSEKRMLATGGEFLLDSRDELDAARSKGFALKAPRSERNRRAVM